MSPSRFQFPSLENEGEYQVTFHTSMVTFHASLSMNCDSVIDHGGMGDRNVGGRISLCYLVYFQSSNFSFVGVEQVICSSLVRWHSSSPSLWRPLKGSLYKFINEPTGRLFLSYLGNKQTISQSHLEKELSKSLPFFLFWIQAPLLEWGVTRRTTPEHSQLPGASKGWWERQGISNSEWSCLELSGHTRSPCNWSWVYQSEAWPLSSEHISQLPPTTGWACPRGLHDPALSNPQPCRLGRAGTIPASFLFLELT